MKVAKALTFRASSIGDCLMGKYLLENIHAAYSSARLGIVVANRSAMIRDLFAAYPWLEVIEANRRSPRALFLLLMHFNRSDLVVTQYAGKQGGRFSLASKFVARVLAKTGGLIGFTDVSGWNSLLYDKLVPVNSLSATAEHDREALRTAGLEVLVPFPTLAFVHDASVLAKFDLTAGKFIIVHLFAGNASRGLSPEKKRELLSALSEKLPNTRLVISGGDADREEALHVAEGVFATVVAGEVTLQDMMNLIAVSRGVVSVDTGMAHIAAQLGASLVVMRTCIGRAWWLPEQYGTALPITVCDHDETCRNGHAAKEYPECMQAIDMAAVARKVSSL